MRAQHLNRRRPCARILLGAALLAVPGCRNDSGRVHEYNWEVMGTVASLTVRDTDAATARRLQALARATFEAINAEFSVYRSDSLTARINRSGTNAIPISPRFHEILAACRHFHRITDGAFDPTVAPAVRYWGFTDNPAPRALPDPATIAGMLPLIGFQNVLFDHEQVRFARLDMRLDFGGIAKGLAIDAAMEQLLDRYSGPLLLNLGGEMRVHGRPGKSRAWRIGVRDPFNRNAIVGVLELPSGMATATSGHYERFVMLDGTRYSHIIDPRTAFPVSGMAGVTVLCMDSTQADALSTSLFVLGLEHGARLVERLEAVEALFIPDRTPPELHATPGFISRFTPEPAWLNRLRALE